MIQFGKIARAALVSALVMSCTDKDDGGTVIDPVCAGRAPAYWAGGAANVTAADLQKLASFELTACDAFGPYGTAAELAAYLAGAEAEGAEPAYVLCAGWFAFTLNERHNRFACGDADVLFDMNNAQLTCADIEGAVRTALAIGDGDALRAFFAEANGGANVCICPTGTTGGTGGTGGTGSWGE